MRILFVGTSMDIGGIETNLVRLAAALTERGHAVSVVSSGGALVPELERAGARHETMRIGLSQPLGMLRTVIRLPRFVARERFDIVHVTSASANIAFALVPRAARRAWRSISSPMGLQNAEDESPLITDLRNRLLVWRADRVLVISPAIAKALTRIGVPPRTLRPADLVGLSDSMFGASNALRDEWRERLAVAADAAFVTTIGALHPRKSHSLFLRMALLVLRERPTTVFAVVGSGPEESDLRRLALDLGIAGSVRFTGAMSDVRGPLAASDVYVKPGIVEGFIGITVLEAMAASRPVIAFDTEDVRLAITDGITGLIAPVTEPSALAAAVLRLLSDRSLADRVAVAGHRLVSERFRIARVAEGLEREYTDALAAEPRS